MGIKEAAAKSRAEKFSKRGKAHYALCLTCNYDCEVVTDKADARFNYGNCPRYTKEELI